MYYYVKMVSTIAIILSIVFAIIVVAVIVFLAVFWYKMILQFKQKLYSSSSLKNLNEPDSIYKRMADDSEVTEQYEYMRKKLVG